MPQGLFPAKVVGSFFLSFIESSRELKSEYIVRFMDDIYLFSNDELRVIDDIFVIQRLIGEKGLSLNEEKTIISETSNDTEYDIDDSKKSLLEKRRSVINKYTLDDFDDFDEGDDDAEEDNYLTEDEIQYLTNLLHEKNLEEKDIELILTLLSTNEEDINYLVGIVLNHAPHLMNKLYLNLSRNNLLGVEIINKFDDYLNKSSIQEFVLFWLTKIIVDQTVINEYIADLLFKIYKHGSATNIVKGLILELQENNYGFLELKKKISRGHSPELVISAMVGLISHEKGNRNKVYGYVGRIHPMMQVLTNVLSNIEPKDIEDLFRKDENKFLYHPNNQNEITEINPYSGNFDSFEIDDDDLPF